MKPTETQIKQAILHPDEGVRMAAIEYFSESHSPDAEIMPLVIQAIEKYGREQTRPGSKTDVFR